MGKQAVPSWCGGAVLLCGCADRGVEFHYPCRDAGAGRERGGGRQCVSGCHCGFLCITISVYLADALLRAVEVASVWVGHVVGVCIGGGDGGRNRLAVGDFLGAYQHLYESDVPHHIRLGVGACGAA